MRLSTFTLSALVVAEVVNGHGGMNFPATRNLVNSNYCPHCANGKGVCGNGQGSQWTTSEAPALLHGDYETSRTILYSGGVVEVELWITVGHYGILTVELCDNPGATITSDCFKRLKRDPTDQRISPYLPEYPEIVFLLTNECMTLATLNSPAKIRFLVPAAPASVNHGILRMYWNTGNSCSPHPASTKATVDPRVSNFETIFNGATCHVAVSGLGLCGTDCPRDECSGEKFINCADVALVPGNGSSVVTSVDFDQVAVGESVGTNPTSSPQTTRAPTTTTTSRTSTSSSTSSTSSSRSTTESSATPKPTTTTTMQPPSTCSAPSGDEALCATQVKGLQSWHTSYCQERCQTIGSGEDETGRQWCAAKGICALTDCVTSFYSHVCQRV